MVYNYNYTEINVKQNMDKINIWPYRKTSLVLRLLSDNYKISYE